MSPGETANATKQKIGPETALELLTDVDKLVAMKGKKVIEFDLKNDRPDDDALLKEMIGPSGNLRAPTLKVGKVMLVGFHDETYKQYLG